MTLPIVWTAHLTNSPKEKQDFERAVILSTEVLNRLRQILEDREKSIDKLDFSLSSYDHASWPYKQAHLNGRRAELVEIKQLLTL